MKFTQRSILAPLKWYTSPYLNFLSFAKYISHAFNRGVCAEKLPQEKHSAMILNSVFHPTIQYNNTTNRQAGICHSRDFSLQKKFIFPTFSNWFCISSMESWSSPLSTFTSSGYNDLSHYILTTSLWSF